MSISSAVETLPASQPAAPVTPVTPANPGHLEAWLFLLTALSISLAIRLRVFRAKTVVGPKRLADRGSAVTLLVILFIGLCIWTFASAAYYGHLQTQWRKAGHQEIPKNIESLLTPSDMAFVSTVPPLIAFGVMLLAGRFVGRDWLTGLGINLGKMGRGVFAGVVGFLIIGPAVYWTLVIQSVIYQYIKYQHPMEHPLLKSLGESQPGGNAAKLIALGAVICAPLFEELLFRGHLQTFLRQLAMLMSAKREPIVTTTMPVFNELGHPGVELPLAPFAPPVLRPAAWHGWLAIVLTSMIFALFHPAWTWPPIFVLALGLGYAYERTGNLWAPITMHCLFNAFNTLQYYLLMFHGHAGG